MSTLSTFDKSMKVLVVDDYVLTRDMVKAILRQLGFPEYCGRRGWSVGSTGHPRGKDRLSDL